MTRLVVVLIIIGVMMGCAPVMDKGSLTTNNVDHDQKTLSPEEAYHEGQKAERATEYENAIKYYLIAAKDGNVKAELRLGWLYFIKREGVIQDFKASTFWFHHAAEHGNAEAQDSLGDAYYNGTGINQDYSKALMWYQKSANQGNYSAEYSLGYMYLYAVGTDKDINKAFHWISASAKGGNIYGKVVLGYIYSNSEGSLKNMKEAIKILNSVAEDPIWGKLDLPDGPSNLARNQLATIYESGDGVEKNFKKGSEYLQVASAHGSVDAKSRLALSYMLGLGVDKSQSTAIRLFTEVLAIDRSNENAKKFLPVAIAEAAEDGQKEYDNKRFTEAFKSLEPAANHGNLLAQYLLGNMYSSGDGVVKDDSLAVKWWRMAASNGYFDAITALGKAYWLGNEYLNIDSDEALKRLLYSMSNGDPNARDFIEKQVVPGWKFASVDKDDIFLVKIDSIKSYSNTISFWSEDIPIPKAINDNYHFYVADKFYEHADCDNSIFGFESSITYDSGGNITNSTHADSPKMMPIVPDSVGAYVVGVACKYSHKSGAENHTEETVHSASMASAGTAWPLASGYVVTNYHVIGDRNKITLLRTNGEKLSAVVVLHDEANDLVLLKVKDTSKLPPALPLSSESAHIGDKVFTIGYPHPDIMGEAPKLANGIISAATGINDDPRTYQITVPIQAGNSGGPLVDMEGEVVGVTASKLSAVKMFQWTGDLPQNVNYAIKSAYVSILDDAAPRFNKGIKVLQLGNASLSTLAARIKGSIMLVIAE